MPGRPPPHPGPEPVYPNALLPSCPEVHSWQRPAPSRTLLGPAQPEYAWSRTRTPRPARLTPRQARGGGVADPGELGAGTSSNSMSRTRSVLGATSEPFRRDGAPHAVSSARHRLPGGQYLSGKTLNSTRDHTPFSSTPPGSPHTTQTARWGDPRAAAKSLGQKCPGASRDSRLRAPRPAPAARAACAQKLRRGPG